MWIDPIHGVMNFQARWLTATAAGVDPTLPTFYEYKRQQGTNARNSGPPTGTAETGGSLDRAPLKEHK